MEASQLLREGLKTATKNRPPIKGKSVIVAFIAGFLFGPIGCGVYLGSFEDFFVPFTLVLGTTFLTGGIAAPVAWMFCGVYAAMRVG